MRLLSIVLARLNHTKQPPHKLLTHLLGLLLMLPGPVTLRHLSRYSPSHERPFARWYATGFDFLALNKTAIQEVVPSTSAQALVMAASFVPNSGKQTYGLDRLWNGSHSRMEKGLEISVLAWLAFTATCASGLGVAQTAPTGGPAADQEATRIDSYLDQLTGAVSQHDLGHLRYVIPDGSYSTQQFVGGVRALGLHQIGKLRADANLRALSQGPKRPGPGRPKT
jgi:hypothetical protein